MSLIDPQEHSRGGQDSYAGGTSRELPALRLGDRQAKKRAKRCRGMRLTIREIDEEPDVRSTFEGDRNRQRFARRGLRRRQSDPHRDRQGEGVGQRREMALVPVITDSFAPFKTFENRGEFQSFQRFAPLSRRSRVAAPQIFKADSGGRPS